MTGCCSALDSTAPRCHLHLPLSFPFLLPLPPPLPLPCSPFRSRWTWAQEHAPCLCWAATSLTNTWLRTVTTGHEQCSVALLLCKAGRQHCLLSTHSSCLTQCLHSSVSAALMLLPYLAQRSLPSSILAVLSSTLTCWQQLLQPASL